MKLKSAKINEFRTWGLLLTMSGLCLMIIGTGGIVVFGHEIGRIFAYIFLVIGTLALLASLFVYFWAGMMSTNTVSIECPECGKLTKMIGKTDRCMFCHTILTFDSKYAAGQQTVAVEQEGT
ncbi:hypothetical protein PRECH8_26620 [Insulibacter thermoxylanivorax]|uniref:Zinc-ribbon containing domain-containing protein n=1 Tax=Insulibacter thermoxylanivorax TaxID=2749268 RepID=A0A916VH89_9BACL|nr:DUF2614 family zinc ribbon-containing protein [Insulibacter thermoxylanivorax]GFR39366.1 hypothetical protein PRECH8_26620 [Insulibacter thermoxylanivorax]